MLGAVGGHGADYAALPDGAKWLLGLGMLTCIRKALEFVNANEFSEAHVSGGEPMTLANIPPEDPVVYDMICDADTVGTASVAADAEMCMMLADALKETGQASEAIEVLKSALAANTR